MYDTRAFLREVVEVCEFGNGELERYIALGFCCLTETNCVALEAQFYVVVKFVTCLFSNESS